jgi:AcrR family transcriptional regulator
MVNGFPRAGGVIARCDRPARGARRYTAAPVASDGPVTTEPTPRERLLAAAIEHLAQGGSHDLSLRSIAAGIGTSHRMLSYHFGSRSGLLAAIVAELERQQRVFLAEALRDHDASPGELMWRMWDQLADKRMWPYERLFFEMSGRALQDADPGARPLREQLVDPWLEMVDELAARFGRPPAQARAEARLGMAVTRGLLLDLLATGDRGGADEAMRCFIADVERRP